MGAVVSKKKFTKRDTKTKDNNSTYEGSQTVNNNALQQYIEDEEGTFLSVSSKNNTTLPVNNNSSSSAISSVLKSQERFSTYIDQYYQDLETINHQVHHTTSFVLPENWESKEYQYQVNTYKKLSCFSNFNNLSK